MPQFKFDRILSIGPTLYSFNSTELVKNETQPRDVLVWCSTDITSFDDLNQYTLIWINYMVLSLLGPT